MLLLAPICNRCLDRSAGCLKRPVDIVTERGLNTRLRKSVYKDLQIKLARKYMFLNTFCKPQTFAETFAEILLKIKCCREKKCS